MWERNSLENVLHAWIVSFQTAHTRTYTCQSLRWWQLRFHFDMWIIFSPVRTYQSKQHEQRRRQQNKNNILLWPTADTSSPCDERVLFAVVHIQVLRTGRELQLMLIANRNVFINGTSEQRSTTDKLMNDEHIHVLWLSFLPKRKRAKILSRSCWLHLNAISHLHFHFSCAKYPPNQDQKPFLFLHYSERDSQKSSTGKMASIQRYLCISKMRIINTLLQPENGAYFHLLWII